MPKFISFTSLCIVIVYAPIKSINRDPEKTNTKNMHFKNARLQIFTNRELMKIPLNMRFIESAKESRNFNLRISLKKTIWN